MTKEKELVAQKTAVHETIVKGYAIAKENLKKITKLQTKIEEYKTANLWIETQNEQLKLIEADITARIKKERG